MLLDSARSADPPQQLGQHRRQGGEDLARRAPRPRALGVRGEHRQRGLPAVRERTGRQAGEETPPFGILLLPLREPRVPLRVQGLAPGRHLAGPVQRLFLDGELDGRVEAEDLLGRRHLGVAERGAVRGPGVLLGRRGPADDGAQHDERRLVGDRLGRLDRVVQRLGVLVVAVGGHPVDVLHVPAVGRVAGADVLGLGDDRVVLDGDPVVVVDHHQVAELLHAGDGGRLVGDALLDVAVGDDRVDEVVERRLARRGVGGEQAALAARGHRHADGVAEALPERPGGGLDAGRQAVLRVAGGDRSPGTERLEVAELNPVPGQIKLYVKRQRRVAAGQHEPITARPLRVGGVVPHHALVEQVGGGSEGHRRAGVPVADLLHRVHRQDADQVDGPLVSGCPVEGVIAHLYVTDPFCRLLWRPPQPAGNISGVRGERGQGEPPVATMPRLRAYPAPQAGERRGETVSARFIVALV